MLTCGHRWSREYALCSGRCDSQEPTATLKAPEGHCRSSIPTVNDLILIFSKKSQEKKLPDKAVSIECVSPGPCLNMRQATVALPLQRHPFALKNNGLVGCALPLCGLHK